MAPSHSFFRSGAEGSYLPRHGVSLSTDLANNRGQWVQTSSETEKSQSGKHCLTLAYLRCPILSVHLIRSSRDTRGNQSVHQPPHSTKLLDPSHARFHVASLACKLVKLDCDAQDGAF